MKKPEVLIDAAAVLLVVLAAVATGVLGVAVVFWVIASLVHWLGRFL